MRNALALFGTLVLSMSLFSNAGAQQNAPMPTPIVEIYGCNFKDNMDMGDVRGVTARFNTWADRNTVKDYTAFLGTPYLYSTDVTYDLIWLGAYPNGAAMGAGEAQYMTQGQDIIGAFDSTVDCGSHAQYAEVVVHQPSGPPPTNGVALFTDCTVHEGRTVPEALEALEQYTEYTTGRGADTFVAVLFPLGGLPGNADYTFKLVEGHESMQAFGTATDVYTGGGFMRADELFGRLLDCNSPRVYTLERVRLAAAASTD